MYAVRGRLLTCENDDIIEDGLVVVEGDLIKYAGKYNEEILGEKCEILKIKEEDITIMPGFIDCHTHLVGMGSKGFELGESTNYDRILNVVEDLKTLLNAGFTTVRDMSLFGLYLSKAVQREAVKGPRIFPGGRVLGITGGHSDGNIYFSKSYLNKENPINYIVDGKDECIKGVREQFRAGAKFIKICATGGVSSMADELDDVQFSMEELKTIVEEAGRHGTYVAAHCSGGAGTYQALKAGIKSVEHGINLDDKCIELMDRNKSFLVPTLSISIGIPNYKGLPDFMVEKGKLCLDSHLKSLELAKKSNIRIGYGTDFSNSENTPFEENGKEFESLVYAGFTPLEAVKIGTKNSAEIVKMRDKIGTLRKGKLADIVIVKGNPLENISILSDSNKIKIVIKNGNIEKLIN